MKKTIVSLLLATLLAFSMIPGLAESGDVGYPEEITIFTGIGDHTSKLGITSYNDMPLWQELENRTGTHVNFIHPAAGSDTMAQINLMVASHDLPDILTGVNWKTVSGGAQMWEEDGIIIDLTELIPEYMPNYWTRINNIELSIPTLSVDGKLYYVNEIQHGVMFEGPIIRQDWLQKAGLEEPKTLDDLYNVLVYFRDNDMNGNGDASDEWAMSSLGATSIGWSPLNLMWAYGVHWSYMVVDGQVTHGMLMDEFADAITFMNKLYAEGLLDPDYATQDRTALDGKFMNDQVGFEWGIQPTKMDRTMNPDMEEGKFHAAGIPLPKLTEDSPAYSFDKNYVSLFTGASAAVTTRSSEPEKILHWMDYFYSDEGVMLCNYGIEGLTFEYDENGKPYTDTKGAEAVNPDVNANEIKYLYALSGTSAFPYANDSDLFRSSMHPFSAAGTVKWMSEFDVSRLLPDISLTAEEAEDINDTLVDIDTYVSIQLDKLVNGQTSLDEIPAIQKKLIDMGIEDVLEVYQAAYERFMSAE